MTMINPPLPRSLWAAVTPPGPTYAVLEGDQVADVVVIGAGFTGLSTALHLRERGVDVAVVEAAEPGWGASGRNNGQVIPTLSGHDPSAVVARYGEAGERLNRLVRDCASDLFDLVRRYGIEAEAEQAGWVQPVHTPGRLKLAEKRVREWSDLGAQVEFLSREAVADMLGSTAWHGGFWNPTGGHVNPLALARGLGVTASRLGARIFVRSPVESYVHDGRGWQVNCPGGSIRARALVLATNAYTGEFSQNLDPRIALEVIPVLSWQMATRSIGDNVAKTIIPARQAMSDTHRELYFTRWDARGRLIAGGAAMLPGADGNAVRSLVGKRLERLWPQLGDVTFDYVWSGYVGMTPDNVLRPDKVGFPRVHQVGPEGFAWTGCNGRGVGLSVALGREFARLLTGTPIEDLALPVSEPKPRKLQPILRRVAPFALPYYRYLDRQEI